MSRTDDLIDLLQTTNDIFLMNTAQNVRSAYILIDDLCELTMKSWLQLNTKQRQDQFIVDLKEAGIITSKNHHKSIRAHFSKDKTFGDLAEALGSSKGPNRDTLDRIFSQYSPLQDWSAEHPDGRFKAFHNLIEEVKQRRPTTGYPELHNILDRINERRENRNHFFHDPALAGLTVDEKNCLRAFDDLYRLASLLLGTEFDNTVHANSIVLAQFTVIRLRLKGYDTRVAHGVYQQCLQNRGAISIPYNGLAHEFCSLYEDPTRFLESIRSAVEGEILSRRQEINRINGLTKKNRRHEQNLERISREIILYEEIVNDCLDH